MGLDSVELIIEFEKYFNITIPDKEAEKVDTVEKAVNCIAKLRSINDSDDKVRFKMFEEIKFTLQSNNICNANFLINDKLIDFIPPENIPWDFFEEKIELEIPKPFVKKGNHYIFQKIAKTFHLDSNNNYGAISFLQLTDAILTCNFRELIDSNLITTKYEVYIAVSGITVEKIGVDYYEIAPDKSFTNDLGVD